MKSIVLPMVMLVFAIGHAAAQSRTYNGKKLTPIRSYNNPSLVREKAGTTVPLFDEAGYPYQGVGLKLGDPFAVTFKFYVSERIALVADFGRTASALYKTYYEGLFNNYFPDPIDTLSLTSHKVTADWVGELKLLYHIDANELTKGLKFYTGLGWQVRDTKLEYTYDVQEPAEPMELTSTRRHQTQGITAIGGIEYANFGAPIAVFIETVLYYDLSKDKGWTRLQGGVGIRYIF
jgi:hypothetical protein